MAVARFQLEDGRIARFEVPDGTTPEQAQASIAEIIATQGIPDVSSTDTTRDTSSQSLPGQPGGQAPQQLGGQRRAAARRDTAERASGQPGVADLFTGESRTTPEIEALAEIGDAPELNELSVSAFKTSLGLLSTGKTEELKSILKSQLGDKVSFRQDAKGNEIVTLPSGDFALNKPGFSPQDLIRGVFDVAAFTPAGRAASVTGAIGKAAATEAAIETGEAGLGGEFSVEDVALAGGLSGIFKGVGDAIGAGFRALKGTPRSELIEAGEAAGIPVTTSDVLPPQTFAGKIAQQTAEKIPIAGTGGIREAQQEARQAAVADVAQRYGQFSYGAVVESIKSQKNKVKEAAGSVLERTGNKLDSSGEIAIPNTVSAIDGARAELTKPGVIQSEGAIQDLLTLSDSVTGAPQTFTTLKENRTAFNEIIKGADKGERTQLTSRAKSLLQAVSSAMKSDMDELAKASLTPREFNQWQKANQVYAREAEKLTKSRLKNVLDKGDVTPESVETLLFSQKPSEVKSLFQSLTTEGRANARSAIISRVITDLGKRAGGITPNTFLSELKKKNLATSIFFRGEEKKQLNGLLKVLDATRRAQDAAVTTPTGQQLLGAGTIGAAVVDLGATLGAGGTIGGLARVYESQAVRNALIRLDSIPRGSTKFEAALNDAVSSITTASQAARE